MKIKSNIFKYGFMSLMAGVMLTACSDKDEPDNDPSDFDSTEVIMVSSEDFRWDSNGVWAGNNTADGFLNIDDYEFSHYFDNSTPGMEYAYGFTPSKVTENGKYDNMYDFHQYASISGGGINGAGSPYLVGYWSYFQEQEEFNTKTCRVEAEDGDLFMPQSVMVNNTSLVYYILKDGNGFSEPFKDGDYLTLLVHGVHQDNNNPKPVEISLADFRDGKSFIMNEWTEFDLTSLGICTGIYFTMESSDSSPAYGMNTPAYFCLDKLVVKD